MCDLVEVSEDSGGVLDEAADVNLEIDRALVVDLEVVDGADEDARFGFGGEFDVEDGEAEQCWDRGTG